MSHFDYLTSLTLLDLSRYLYSKHPIYELTAVVKKVVGTHYFLAIFGPLGAHFNPQPLRQPHGMTVSHIVKVNHTVVERGLEYC